MAQDLEPALRRSLEADYAAGAEIDVLLDRLRSSGLSKPNCAMWLARITGMPWIDALNATNSSATWAERRDFDERVNLEFGDFLAQEHGNPPDGGDA